MKPILILVLAAFTLAGTTFAQGRRGGPPPDVTGRDGLTRGGAPRDPTAQLKAALNLTDAQVTAIKALMETRETRAQALRTEIDAKRQALNALLAAASPSPVDVGNAAIALNASEKKMAAERDWFITELKKLLTGEQQTTLDNLIAARTPLLPGLGGGGPGGRGGRGPR